MDKIRLSASRRRELIVEAALGVFSENGYNGSTIKLIAERARVNEGLIYKHFKSKEELYVAILDTRHSEGFDSDGLVAMMKKGDDRKVFMCFAGAYLNVLRSNDKLVKLITFGQLTSPDLATPRIFRIPFDGSDQSPVTILADYIKRKIKEGTFVKSKPKLVARIFVGMIHWYGLRRMIANSKQWNVYEEREVLDTMINLFLNGLITRGNKELRAKGGDSGF